MSTYPTKTPEDKTINTLEDKRKSQETVRCRILGSGKVPGVDTSFCPSLKTKTLPLPLICLYKKS